jgi:hypothetical protein
MRGIACRVGLLLFLREKKSITESSNKKKSHILNTMQAYERLHIPSNESNRYVLLIFTSFYYVSMQINKRTKKTCKNLFKLTILHLVFETSTTFPLFLILLTCVLLQSIIKFRPYVYFKHFHWGCGHSSQCNFLCFQKCSMQ